MGDKIDKKKIVFLSGTRADYGKMKSLMQALEKNDKFEVFVFVCGMHLSKMHGSTYREVKKDGYAHVHIAYGLQETQDASMNFGNTVSYFSGYVDKIEPDMIIIHGDRMDALAGAIVGALHNIMVGHIEGGEVSGTIDESIRHAISKFAHVHFCSTEEAGKRLMQLGEELSRIYVIGSPDIDIMMNEKLPDLKETRERYDLKFGSYSILMYHPVTTEYDSIGVNIKNVVDAVIASGRNYIVIYPNNDLGSEIILNEYRRLFNNDRFKIFPSLRFEYFLTLLKNADFIIGNSSAGIREAGIYGIPAIDIGTRQMGRYEDMGLSNIVHVSECVDEIEDAIKNFKQYKREGHVFGDGKSTERFVDIVNDPDFWNLEIQKQFIDHM